MYRCSLHFVDCKWELTTCASKHSLVYAIDEIQISDKKWGCARDKGSKAEPEFNVLISIWGLCWCNFFSSGRFLNSKPQVNAHGAPPIEVPLVGPGFSGVVLRLKINMSRAPNMAWVHKTFSYGWMWLTVS